MIKGDRQILYSKYKWIIPAVFFAVFCISCNKDKDEPEVTVSTDFECGSIGEVVKLDNTSWELYLADDNDNPDLPDNWRNWWYVKIDHVLQDDSIEITLKNRGWPFYYLPVYSYDQVIWNRFAEEEVTQNEDNELIMKKQFEGETVWIARFYPYTFTDLENYINSINSQYVSIQTVGYSQNDNPIYVLKVTDFNVPDSNKERIVMHARTHPAETSPSFLIEGMIDFLTAGTPEASEILAGFEFYIFPMQNVDGVIAGNYRTTPQTENLEVMWYYDSDNPLNLTNEAPPEVTIIQQYAKSLMNDEGPQVSMALNLHASNSEPDIRPFFFPHFGTEDQGYTSIEASLWEKQISFIGTVATHMGEDMIEPIPEQGGSSFASKTYPESWWWVNFKDEVMAITFEMTYGKAGYAPKWIEPDDMRDIGSSLVLSIRDYYDESFIPAQFTLKARRNTSLKYPELYPPNAADELKE